MEKDYKSPFNPKPIIDQKQEYGGDLSSSCKDYASQNMDNNKENKKHEGK